jgi:hypothetical protein
VDGLHTLYRQMMPAAPVKKSGSCGGVGLARISISDVDGKKLNEAPLGPFLWSNHIGKNCGVIDRRLAVANCPYALLPIPQQIELILPDLVRSELVWWSLEILRKIRNCLDVAGYGSL